MNERSEGPALDAGGTESAALDAGGTEPPLMLSPAPAPARAFTANPGPKCSGPVGTTASSSCTKNCGSSASGKVSRITLPEPWSSNAPQ